MRIAPEAWPFVLPAVGSAAGLGVIGWWRCGLGLLLVGAALALFFRVPHRRDPRDPHAVVAPASGRVLRIDEVADAEVGTGSWQRVVTFLSAFDVHVQRAPVAGEVVHTAFRPGRKVAAFHPEAGEVNECRLLVLRHGSGELVGVRQIAGLLARRTVAYPRAGDRLQRGALIGLIKFGSRVDLLLPPSYTVAVRPGERLRDGETIVARSVQP